MSFWFLGVPSFRVSSHLNCLSVNNKNIIWSSVFCRSSFKVDSIIIDRYSSLSKLLRITTLIYKFIKWVKVNCRNLAWSFLWKVMQKESFEDEIKFLSNSSKGSTSGFSEDFDFIFDKKEIISCSYSGNYQTYNLGFKPPLDCAYKRLP